MEVFLKTSLVLARFTVVQTYLRQTVDIKVSWWDFNLCAEKYPLGARLCGVKGGYLWLGTQNWDI